MKCPPRRVVNRVKFAEVLARQSDALLGGPLQVDSEQHLCPAMSLSK